MDMTGLGFPTTFANFKPNTSLSQDFHLCAYNPSSSNIPPQNAQDRI
jgi:hypothetical protein